MMKSSLNVEEPKYDFVQDQCNTKIRVTAPGDLPTGYTFEASYTLPFNDEEISFEATVVSSGQKTSSIFFRLSTRTNTALHGLSAIL